ncbi:MAG: peptidoglycan-binding protein [Symploca sp. SIO2C1]|nr:peptidoglycan-binding protein [Symploca sp. SIO2C1]
MAKSMMLSLANTSCLVCWSLLSGLTLILAKPVVAAETEVATTIIAQGISVATVTRPILSIGSEGKAVAELQAALQLLGYYTGAVDGIYAESTASAVSLFQQTAGITVDGITGPTTWDHLFPSTPSAVNSTPITPNNPTNLNPPPLIPNNPARPTLPAATSSDNSASSFPIPSALQTTPKRNSPAQNNSATISQTAANPQPTSIDLPILKEGMRGSAISRLQDRLRSLGFLQGEADGVFGSETLAAVKAAQSNFRLEPDGVVGPATWRALLR